MFCVIIILRSIFTFSLVIMSKDLCKIPELINGIFNKIEESMRNSSSKQLSDQDFVTLYSVFGLVLKRALEILEKQPVLEVYTTANESTSLIEVKGERDLCYRIFPKVNFCPCQAFKHQVLEKRTQLTCKHVLAGKIALLLGKTKIHQVTQEQYQMLVHSMFE